MRSHRKSYKGFSGWCAAVLVAIDRLLNVVTGGNPDDTICERWVKRAGKEKPVK